MSIVSVFAPTSTTAPTKHQQTRCRHACTLTASTASYRLNSLVGATAGRTGCRATLLLLLSEHLRLLGLLDLLRGNLVGLGHGVLDDGLLLG